MWKKWGSPQNFLLAFIDELWKTQKIRILKKMKKNCWRYHHFTQVYQKLQSYETQFLRYWVRQTEFFVISVHFLPLYTPDNQKNRNFKTMKKASWDLTTLQMCSKNHDHMMYASWDMEYDRPNFLSFWIIFCLFTPLLTPKIKIWNKFFLKKLEILSCYTCVHTWR